jgi:hypothetical protein
MKFLMSTFAASLLCLSIALPTSAFARLQEPTPAVQKAQELSQVLNLSAQQKSQLTPILQAEEPKVKEVMQDPNLTPEQKKSKLKGVHSQTDSLVKSILTPPQYKQWETIRKDELKNMK